MGTGTGTRTRLGRADVKPRRAKNHTRVVDAIRHFHSARVIICTNRRCACGPRQLHSQGPISVHAYRTEGVTESDEREGANGVGGGIGVRGGNGGGGGNGDVKR